MSSFQNGKARPLCRSLLNFIGGCRILIGILLFSVTSVAAQTANKASQPKQQLQSTSKVMYTGVVLDNDGEPLVGVSVKVKGRSETAVTNGDGFYRLDLPNGKYTFVYSYLGMKTQEVLVNSTKRYTVRMQDDAHELGETVITGIFSRNMESFTGSAATYSSQELKTIGNQNVLQSLSALDPSFVIADNLEMGSDPNSPMSITINGTTSIRGLSETYGTDPNMPLFILDGFETTLARISDMSMDRIESITILKDAASTAIYGSKAANGVVVVETKKPEAGKLRFTYNGNYKIEWADLSDYNLMNASEKLEYEKLAGFYGTLDANGEILSDGYRETYYNRYMRVVAGLDSYWMNEPLRTGVSHEHSVGAEGGDSAFRYGLTFRMRNNPGVMKGSDRKNIDGSVNLSYRIDKFNFSNQTNVYFTDADNNVVLFSAFSEANPFQAKRNQYGEAQMALESYGNGQYVWNPLWDFQQKSFSRNDQLQLNNNFNVDYRPVDRLRINARFGFNLTRGKTENFTSPNATTYVDVEDGKKGSYRRSDDDGVSYDGSLIVSWGDVIGKHTYNLVGGANLTERSSKNAAYEAIGYISDKFWNPNFSSGYVQNGKPSSSVDKSRSAGFYMNGNYAYDLRYLFDFNVRSDGSSVFGINNPFSTTWSAGVAWNIHNEKWFKESKVVNTLKLRYSYGNPGNQNLDAKLANSVYNYYTTYPNIFGLAAVVSKWGNSNLKWKRVKTHNIGIDMTLFKRLYLTANYIFRDSNPEVMSIGQPTSTGTSTIPMNIGAIDNRSFSLTASYDIIKKRDLFWKVSVNAMCTKSEYYNIGDLLERLNQEGRTNQTLMRYYDGASTSALWAVKSAGIDPMTGNEVFVRKDGTYTFKWDSAEEQVCGDATPDVQGNINTNLRWKQWSFNASFRYTLGGDAQLTALLNKVENIDQTSVRYNQDKRALHDRWQKPGDVAKFKRIDDLSHTNMSSRFIAEENTLQCTSISIGYDDTTSAWIKKCGLTSINFRIYTNNIFRLSTIKEERGIRYPFSRSVSASLGLRF